MLQILQKINTKRNIKIAQLGITFILLFFLYSLIDKKTFLEIIFNAKMEYIFSGMLLYIVGLLISTKKWMISIFSITKELFGFFHLFKLYWIGSFFSNFLPSSFGGDGYRYYQINKKIKLKIISLETIFFERLSGIITLSLINIILSFYFYSSFYNQQNILFLLSVTLAFAVIISLILLKYYPRIIMLKKIKDRFNNLQYPEKFWQLILLSVVFILNSAYMINFYLLAYGIDYINIIYLMLIITSSNLIGLIPISLNSIGISESVWVFYLTHVGVPIEVALLVAITGRISLIIMSGLGGLFLLLKKNKIIKT